MLTLSEIKDHVFNNGFGRVEVASHTYISNGLSYALKCERVVWESYLKKAYQQVREEDYGDFYEYGESPILGNEYYLCESPFGCDIWEGIVAHRENGNLIFYFQFER